MPQSYFQRANTQCLKESIPKKGFIIQHIHTDENAHIRIRLSAVAIVLHCTCTESEVELLSSL